MDIDFREYLQNQNIDQSSISSELLSYLEVAYNVYDIKPAPLLLPDKYTEEEIKDKVDRIILRLYEIKFHNIGNNPYDRFYKYGGHYEWLKTLHVLISHVYYYAKEFKNHELVDNSSNRKIAIKLGYISEHESNQDIIQKALRKVTDSLGVLKAMDLITVKHIHKPGKRGSKHRIRINWIKVIDLFTNHDYNASGSIRIRKTIRYRIISFVKDAKKKASEALRRLMQKQESQYLRDVVTFNLERFQEDKFLIFKILASDRYLKCLALNKSDFNTDNIVPIIEGEDLYLRVKNERVYNELNNESSIIDDFKAKYNLDVLVVPVF